MAKKGVLLLTGAGGMVGSNILEHPRLMDWHVLAPRRAELDLADPAATLAYVSHHQPDAIVHAAGRVGGIQANMAHPVDFLVSNVDVGRNVIMAARHAGVKRLLNLASSCMYPRAAENPLTEDMILQGELEPTNEGYALAKIFATRLCAYIRREQPALSYKTLIPCNLYGRYDKFAPEHSHLIPAIIHKIYQAMQEGHDEVEIWGDGTARREFMYAGDLADVVVRALEGFASLPVEMNVGLGNDYSINEYYRTVAEVIGWQGRFVHNASRPVGMKRKQVSIERQRTWGWMPPTSLREGILQTYQFYLKEYAS